MPKPGHISVTITQSAAAQLDKLPGRSRMDKVHRLISDRTNKLDHEESGDAIAYIEKNIDNWSIVSVWRLLDIVLSQLRRAAPDTTETDLFRKMLNGEYPTDLEIIETCQAMDLPEEKMFALRNCLFPKNDVNNTAKS